MSKDSFTAIIATDQPDALGQKFSDEALRKLAHESAGIPVRVNFQGPVIGVVTDGFDTRNGVRIEGNFEYDLTAFERVYAVTAGIVKRKHDEAGVTVIDDFTVKEVSLVSNPANSHITPIVLMKGSK